MSVAAAVQNPHPHPEQPAVASQPAAGGVPQPSGGNDPRPAESRARQLLKEACVEPAAKAATLPATCKPAASVLKQAQQADRSNRSVAEDEVTAVRAEVEASKPDAVGAERPSSGKLESTLIWTSGFVERLLEVLGLAPSPGLLRICQLCASPRLALPVGCDASSNKKGTTPACYLLTTISMNKVGLVARRITCIHC